MSSPASKAVTTAIAALMAFPAKWDRIILECAEASHRPLPALPEPARISALPEPARIPALPEPARIPALPANLVDSVLLLAVPVLARVRHGLTALPAALPAILVDSDLLPAVLPAVLTDWAGRAAPAR